MSSGEISAKPLKCISFVSDLLVPKENNYIYPLLIYGHILPIYAKFQINLGKTLCLTMILLRRCSLSLNSASN